MKRLTFLLFFACAPLSAQDLSDSRLIMEASFDNGIYNEAVPDSLSFFGRTAVILDRQLTGECFYEPECYVFSGQALKKFGVIPGLFIISDRITRCSRIGTVQGHHFSEDGKIHEGIEVYTTGKRRRKQ